MAETLYTPSSSGYASDWFTVNEYNNPVYAGKNGWSTSTSTIIQGGSNGAGSFHYYGIIYFDFAAMRTKGQTHKPKAIRIRLKSHVGSDKTIYLHIGKGMAKDSFSFSDRPTDADGTSVKTFSCSANAWGEIVVTDAAWLDALLNPGTTCFYINRYATGSGSDDISSYWEGDGAAHTNKPELYVDWEPKGTVRYCTGGTWVECEVFYGTGSAWVKVAPHYCTDGTWKPIGG